MFCCSRLVAVAPSLLVYGAMAGTTSPANFSRGLTPQVERLLFRFGLDRPERFLMLRIAIVGTEVAGLAAAARAIAMLGRENVEITFFEPRGWVGGLIKTGASGDFGPGFLGKKRHPELDCFLAACLANQEGWESTIYLGDDEPTFPEDSSYAAGSGVTDYYGESGEKLDSDEVEAGLSVLREQYIPQLCAALKLTGMDPRNLTEQQELLQRMSTDQWFQGAALPGVDIPFPVTSAAALTSFRLMWKHDNGAALSEQNLLAMLRMMDGAGHGYYSGGTKIVRGGGSTIVRVPQQWLESQGVKFLLNTPAYLDSKEAVLRMEDGSKLSFDRVIIATPPSVHDECIFDPDFQMGQALFWNIALRPEFAKTIATWDTFGPWGETWQSFLHRDTLVFFAGDDGYRDAAMAPPVDKFELMFPGIAQNIVSQETMDWPATPWVKGSFSFPAPGKFGAVSRSLTHHLESPIAVVGEWNSDEVGYPGAAVRIAEQVVTEMLS